MHEKSPVLTATTRDRLGSRYTRRLREQGHLPAVVYGHKEEPRSIYIDAHNALIHFNKGEKVFTLQLDGKDQTVLLKDLQFDHLGSRIIHADLARVSLTDRVTVLVPVRFVGEAKGLKTVGAILMHPASELEVECLVTEIPDALEVDITELDVGHAITAADVKLPSASMKLKTDKRAMVAQIVIQLEIVEEKPEEAVVEAGALEPEVITAKKKEGEEGEEGAAPGAKPAAGAKPGAPGAKPAAGAAAKPGAAPAKPAAGAKPAPGGDKKK